MTRLGFLHIEEEFILDNVRYKAISVDGNGYARCKNLENGKIKKICLDVDVEEIEQMKGDKE